ncbi:RNA 3'-terminal phosphate cyclase [Candidatus Burarchaeum australiense]|nr:RNA 3'-terminal phosphate cyclase [Candidatus Burarchaeum australiense]
MLELDGGTLEGGGQILRSASALSCLLGKPFRVVKIRANRPKPGLQAQHLAGILALSELCGAKTEGASLGSTSLSFSPGKLRSGKFSFAVGTAGAVTLVAQTLLPALLFAPGPTTITLRGGTHVPFAPTFDYFAHVLLPSLASMGARASASLSRYGWYPKGAGEVVLEVLPCQRLQPTELLKRGELKTITGISCTSNLPPHVAQRQADTVRRSFPQADLRIDSAPAACPGSAVTVWAVFVSGSQGAPAPRTSPLGSSSLGKIGKSAEIVGEEAALALDALISSNAAVDEHLADQLMIFMVLAEGRSSLRAPKVTSHMRTNAWLIEQFTDKKVLIDDGSNTIVIDGLGLQNPFAERKQ